MFSLDQRIRMRATLSSIRAELCSADNLLATGADCDFPTSIKLPLQSPQIRIYPNPAWEYIHIEYGQIYPGNQTTHITIYDRFGNEVLKRSGIDITRLDIIGIPSGFYIMKVKTGNTQMKEKFIKGY